MSSIQILTVFGYLLRFGSQILSERAAFVPSRSALGSKRVLVQDKKNYFKLWVQQGSNSKSGDYQG